MALFQRHLPEIPSLLNSMWSDGGVLCVHFGAELLFELVLKGHVSPRGSSPTDVLLFPAVTPYLGHPAAFTYHKFHTARSYRALRL